MQINDFVRTMQNPGGARRISRSMNIDLILLVLLFALCAFGLAVLYSAGGQDLSYVKRQLTFMTVGFALMLIVAQVSVRSLERWAFVIYGLGLVSLFAVLIFGVGAKGAQRWLDLGFTRLQPAELMKVSVPLMWLFVLRDYQKQRILTLLSPEDDTLGSGWNIIQSKTAIGSGGFEGKGWTEGTQSQLSFLPESHTDFIIAVLAEEFGLIGVLALCTLYLLVIGRSLVIATNAQSQFGRLLAGSLASIFFVYIFVNMGMVSGILPVVGAPLPMISYGGTAILTLFIGFGMLMAISREPRQMRTQF